jgi:hypothetical protein
VSVGCVFGLVAAGVGAPTAVAADPCTAVFPGVAMSFGGARGQNVDTRSRIEGMTDDYRIDSDSRQTCGR